MGQRPPHVRPPAYLSKSPPLPAAAASARTDAASHDSKGNSGHEPDPTRYGDWVIKGIAIDF